MEKATSDAAEILLLEFGDDPEYLEMVAEEHVKARPVKPTSTDAQKEIGDSAARVSALLRQWQQEYGLPPRPDGKVHASAAELSAQWDAEDAALTPEEADAERRRWEDDQERREGVAI